MILRLLIQRIPVVFQIRQRRSHSFNYDSIRIPGCYDDRVFEAKTVVNRLL